MKSRRDLMPRELRLKIAREYLGMLEKAGGRKLLLLRTSEKHHVSQRSILRYVAELRVTLCHH